MTLFNGDLKDTIKNLISIDEYEPKTGKVEDIIVVGFYVVYEDPAKDLNDFLQKSAIDIIDVDVSPNPNTKGMYLVFVEIERNSNFFNILLELLKEIKNLVGNIKWEVSPYLDDGIYPINDIRWRQYVSTSPEQYLSKAEFKKNHKQDEPETEEEDQVEESAREFFSDAGLSVIEEGSFIKIQGKTPIIMETIFWSTEDQLMKNTEFFKHPFILNEQACGTISLQQVLGNAWEIYTHNNNTLIVNPYTKRVLYAKVA